MNKDLSSETFFVFDHHGLFLPLALCLARTGARVFYQTPQDRRDELNDAIIGDGMSDLNVVCTDDLWDVKQSHDIGTYVFPDVRHVGEQLELRAQGLAVWGAGRAMNLELDRELFLDQLTRVGLDVPPHDIIVGVSALRDHLRDREDIYVKTSKWRGSWETRHWRSWAQDGHRLDLWAVRFGGVRERIRFLCFPKIDTKLEIGGDTFCIDGQWPETMLHGIEKKDEAYFSAVTATADMPVQLRQIMKAFSPYLKANQFRQQWSMEDRVTTTKSFFIDATARGGLPSTGSQIVGMINFPEVIYEGARGHLVQPRYNCRFTAECMVKIRGDAGSWDTIVVPPELRPFLMLADCCHVDGQPWFPSDEAAIEEIGWLVAVGDTPIETAKRMNELADMLPDGADAAVEALADIVREVEAEEAQGISFTEEPMPEPEVVLEPSTE